MKNTISKKTILSRLIMSAMVLLIICLPLVGGSGEALAASRYYKVRLVTNLPATCSTIYDDAGFHVVRRCGGEDCYRQIRTAATTGIETVRGDFKDAIQEREYDMKAEVSSGSCTD